MEVKTQKEYQMPFTPPPIPCPNCKRWDVADKGKCQYPGCDWGHIYFEIDLARVPDKLMKDVFVNNPPAAG